MEEIVNVKNLVKRYGDKIAVDNMNLSIQKGEVVGLLGPNGAGKTTLINSIIGITPVQSGEICLFGKNMKHHAMEIKRHVGVVPQNIALLGDFSAYDNVKYFGSLYGLRGTELKDSVKKALDFTNLWDRRRDRPKKYSGGMQRRLNIACSIVHRPELIIMDEPTVGIDPQSRNHILESIKRLAELGSTIIYTSHYIEEVEALCSRVIIMDNGRLIAEGTKEKLAEYVQEDHVAEIAVRSIGPTLIEQIKAMADVKECSLENDKLTVVLEKADAISKVITVIAEGGGRIGKIDMKEASLEEVFLSLTGKTLRD